MIPISNWFRLILGFLVAPISPGLLIVIPAIVFGFGNMGEGIWLITLAGMLGYPIAIILGISLFILFRSRGWNGLLIYVMSGAFLGLIIYVISLPFGGYSSSDMLRLFERFSNTAHVHAPLGMICGAIAALLFWLIARPDRSGYKRNAGN